MKWLLTMFMVFGLVWLTLGGYYWWLENSPSTSLAFSDYPIENLDKEVSAESEGFNVQPTEITIDDLNINLPIIPAKIEDNILETTDKGASYLLSTPIPGNIGNSIIYAHNWTRLFGNLVGAKSGQDVIISYADGSQKRFVIGQTSTVYPTSSEVLSPTDDNRITLYTCTGFLDSKRFVAVAYLDEDPSFADVRR